MTSNVSNLTEIVVYTSTGRLIMGNGASILVDHVCFSTIVSGQSSSSQTCSCS